MHLKNVKEAKILTDFYTVIDPNFGNQYSKIELDLGCGKGGFSLELAKRNPQTFVLAADIKLARLKRINNKAAFLKIENIQTIRVMAWDLVAYLLPDNCLDRIHILCPDPWPKTRHRANRLITSEFLARIANVMKNNGVLHLSTDDEAYFEWMNKAICQLPFYKEFSKGILDVADIKTEFELRYNKIGKPVNHISFLLEK